jgi:hypothetical protein
MTHVILDCKRSNCINYFGQCRWMRMTRIVEDSVYCEDENLETFDEENVECE